MPGADDWRWRSGASIDRDTAGPWPDHRKPVWHKPPSLRRTAVAKIDGTVLDQPLRRLVLRSVVVGDDGVVSNQRGTCRAEYAAKNLYRQKERIERAYPAGVVRRRSARRY